MLKRLFREIFRRFAFEGDLAKVGKSNDIFELNFSNDVAVQRLKVPLFKGEIEAQNWLRLVVVPYLNDCARLGKLLEAEWAEHNAYTQAIKIFENRRHYEECFRILYPPLQELGSHARSLISDFRPTLESSWKPTRLTFFVHNLDADLAHNELLASLIRSYLAKSQAEHNGVIPFRLVGGGVAPAKCYVSLAQDFCISIECLGLESLYSRLESIARQLDRNVNERCIVVAAPIGVSYLCGRVDPWRLGWLSMKFEIDAFSPSLPCYAFTTSERSCHRLGATTWRTAPPLMNKGELAIKTDSSLFIKDASDWEQFDVILFTINREEKIRNLVYLQTVSTILEENPKACFVWTGRVRLREIDEFFRCRNIAHRTFFVGWIDPDLLLQRGDIFLDTPSLSGMTAAKAVANGVPVVTFSGANSWVNFFADKLNNIECQIQDSVWRQNLDEFQDAGLQLECESVQKYTSQVRRLIEDEALRAIYGNFMKAFGEKFFYGNSEYANMHFQNFFTSVSENV